MKDIVYYTKNANNLTFIINRKNIGRQPYMDGSFKSTERGSNEETKWKFVLKIKTRQLKFGGHMRKED